jgi:NAD(P)-dependent dehydrogenase (short-subunit alcohol dehydrogenase family)
MYPGVIQTPMIERVLDKGDICEEQIFASEPMHRMGKPEEIAEPLLGASHGGRVKEVRVCQRWIGPRGRADPEFDRVAHLLHFS